jgi:hypothetical protein
MLTYAAVCDDKQRYETWQLSKLKGQPRHRNDARGLNTGSFGPQRGPQLAMNRSLSQAEGGGEGAVTPWTSVLNHAQVLVGGHADALRGG